MKKKLFNNYNFEFDKNEKKILTTFCNQILKQMEGKSEYFREIKAFNSIIEKLNSGEEKIRFTKEEKTKLESQLKENAKILKKQLEKSGFIKKWLVKSMYNQYNSIITKHFS